jgi:hypothetical protein
MLTTLKEKSALTGFKEVFLMGAVLFAIGYGLSIMTGGLLVLLWIPREFKKAAAKMAGERPES